LHEWLAQTRPGGVMLLASHFTSKQELKDFVAFLRQETKKLQLPHLLITVDWEGGIVSRPTKVGGFASVPSPWALAQAGRSACFLGGMLIGSQLRDFDIDVTFAPSLDLFDPENHILATRCFAQDPDKTAEAGTAFCKGLMSQGVMPCIKHFPGLGVGKLDTHLDTVSLNLDAQGLNHHMQPFLKALEAGIPMVMCTHAQHDFFGKDPITLEPKPVAFLKEKNKNALVITDDFSMKGVHVKGTVEEASLQALCAGYDMIIFSGKPEEQVDMLNNLHVLAKKLSQKHKQVLELAQKHVDYCKKQHLYTSRRKQEIPVDEKALSSFLAKRCFQVPEHVKLLGSGKNICLISTNLPKIRPPEKWFIENDQSYLGMRLANKDKSVTEYILDPKDVKSVDDIVQICSTLDSNTMLVVQTFFYADNIWNTVQRQWLELLEPYQDRTIVISLGHPLEQTVLPNASVIHLGSFGDALLDNVANYLCDDQELTGADRLARSPARYLAGKKIGLLCHKCSVVHHDGNVEFLPDFIHDWAKHRNDDTELAALFCPEHGLLGTQPDSAHVESSHTSDWGCPIHSLHGNNRTPTQAMLENLDVIVIDFQEVGTRCYTYLSTMYLVLEAAAQAQVPVLVLDRPNPLAFWKDTGPFLDSTYSSFLGKVPTKFLHGSTIGGIAQKINKTIGAQLTVLDCCFERSLHHKSSGHKIKDNPDFFFHRDFIPPSPNLGTIDQVYTYPFTVFFEGTNYSEGRGTVSPFLQIGAPWVDKNKLTTALNHLKLPGVYFEPVSFMPQKMVGFADNPKHKDVVCNGFFMHIYDHAKAHPMSSAQAILQTMFTLYPKESQWLSFSKRYTTDLLAGTDTWRKNINAYTKSSRA